jgi:cytochrome b subunit of formate dehydrogenase
MKSLDKYKFNKKLKELGKFVWDSSIIISKLTLLIFFLVTAIIFWQNIAIELYSKYQVDISKQIGQMFLIVLITMILIGIDSITKEK